MHNKELFAYQGLKRLFAENTGTSSIARYIYADGLLIASVNSSTTSYYHEDALGSVRLVSSSTATPIFSANYRGYGSIYAPSGKSTFQYTDKPTDTATGLYYSGARFYDPASGRFMTEDTFTGTLSVPLSLNRYVYALDNPMRYVDPTGHYDVQNNGGGGSAGVSIITENVMVSTTTEETITTYCYEDVCTASTYYALVGTATTIDFPAAPVAISLTSVTMTDTSTQNPLAGLHGLPNGVQIGLGALWLCFGIQGIAAGTVLVAGGTIAAPETLGGSLVGVPIGAGLFAGGLNLAYLGANTLGYGIGEAIKWGLNL